MILEIKYLKHTEINLKKWDACIAASQSNLISATVKFLNGVHPRWDALVINDYESVFPVINKKKYGVNYVFQPYFTQQLGLFGKHEEIATALDLCITELQKRFKYIECNLSYLNKTEKYVGHCSNQVSLQLSLNKPNSELQKAYSKNLTRNLTKANKNNLQLSNSVSVEQVIHLFRENKGKDLKHIREVHYEKLTMLLNGLCKENSVKLVGVKAGNDLIAAAAFSEFNNRLTFLFSGLSEKGRDFFAMPILINHMIEKNSDTEKTMEFNGSNQESLARFYKSFGATEYVYLRLRLNALPWPLNLFKK